MCSWSGVSHVKICLLIWYLNLPEGLTQPFLYSAKQTEHYQRHI